MDGYHLTPDGIPVLVDAIHQAGALREQTGPHLVLSDSSLLGFTAQAVHNSGTLICQEKRNLGSCDKSVVTSWKPACLRPTMRAGPHSFPYRKPLAKRCSCTRSGAPPLQMGGSSETSSASHRRCGLTPAPFVP